MGKKPLLFEKKPRIEELVFPNAERRQAQIVATRLKSRRASFCTKTDAKLCGCCRHLSQSHIASGTSRTSQAQPLEVLRCVEPPAQRKRNFFKLRLRASRPSSIRVLLSAKVPLPLGLRRSASARRTPRASTARSSPDTSAA